MMGEKKAEKCGVCYSVLIGKKRGDKDMRVEDDDMGKLNGLLD
jgi:hypothetical protein